MSTESVTVEDRPGGQEAPRAAERRPAPLWFCLLAGLVVAPVLVFWAPELPWWGRLAVFTALVPVTEGLWRLGARLRHRRREGPETD
ncbi:hypothetical protein [Streptomyces sp. HNM0574]|uniref:hypothetical protein n=1 Tax=Streptomyces sp. HNM0574 TaxID=2714954 RepID=UPI00146ABFD7|nr:hypothetical protein [Streptomyces sp. HNM0574]NLU67047.1 hypothetical protein [Streptomyces sp. HNM0574]